MILQGGKKTTLIFTKCNSFSMGREKICFRIEYGLIQYMIPDPEIVTLFFLKSKRMQVGNWVGQMNMQGIPSSLQSLLFVSFPPLLLCYKNLPTLENPKLVCKFFPFCFATKTSPPCKTLYSKLVFKFFPLALLPKPPHVVKP
jgi:hypothetical protein